MLEEEIIVSDDTNTFCESQGELLPAVVRSEINFLQFPFFALTKRGLKKKIKQEYRFVKERDGKKSELLWKVTANAEYGYPTPFDHKVARAVDVIIDKWYARNGYQLVNPIPFSIYRIAKLMGFGLRKKRGGWLYEKIRDSLKRITATTVESKGSFFLKDEEAWVEDIFHLYERVRFKGMKMPVGGGIAETNYLWLGDEYLRNINARYVRPLDYEFLCSLKNPLSRRSYEVLSPKFYGLDKRLSYYHVDYQDYCQTLPITPQRYYSDVKKQLNRSHEELGSGEFISKVGYVLHKGSKVVKTLRFYLGKRARREQNGELLKRAQYLYVEEQLLLPLSGKETETIELKGLAKELHERGIKPKRVAAELCQNYDEDYIRDKIEMFDFHLKADDGTISDNPPGWLLTAIKRDITPTKKQIKVSKAAVRQQVEEQVRELEREKGKIKTPYSEECSKIFERIIEENPDVVDEAMQEARKENPVIEQCYDESKPYADQMTMVQVVIRPRLRERFPDMFKVVDEKYGQQIEKIDKQIADLQTR